MDNARFNGNTYDNCFTPWRGPSPHQMNGHSLTSSPALNSSSQSSSREASPAFLGKQEFQRVPSPRPSSPTVPMSNGCRSHENGKPFTTHPNQKPYTPWRRAGPTNSTYPNSDPSSNLYLSRAMNNCSITDTSEESLPSASHSPVELLVVNLDQYIDAREIKKILLAWFREHVMVLHVSMFIQSDGNLAATVTVPSLLDAQYAVSQLHRKRMGSKRIAISYISRKQQPPELKRSKVLTLLKEVPGKRLPLFKFRELYERRYHETIGVSEMYSMWDIIEVSDNTSGRMVYLNFEHRSLHSIMADPSMQDPDELRYCKLHSKGPDKSVGWAERDHSALLPAVNLSLKAVSNGLQILLKSHEESVPLSSFIDCYNAEVDVLKEDPNGVPIEHLISCLSWVAIVSGPGGFKHIQKNHSKPSYDPEDLSRYVSPPLVGNLTLFSRELVDLLKTFPHCQLLLTKFIPAYHHHYGRQCRVADYGYTKLADLFESLPHLIQIMGEGNKKMLTLSHRAQVKRFSWDLLRVLKGQPSKIIALDAYPEAYEKIVGKKFHVTDYGVCDIMDLLEKIQDTTVVLKNENGKITIAIPKREQTAEEIERTRLFATEIVELLRHSPECKMQFNRFIPAYHHHYGRQCRVADFGFTKLIELFEAIPDVIKILGEDEDGEKTLQLVEKERLRILGDQIFNLVRNSPKQVIGLTALPAVFMHYYGYSLRPLNYDCCDFAELIGKLRNFVKIDDPEYEQKVTLVDRSSIIDLWVKSRQILWDEPTCSLSAEVFTRKFTERFKQTPDLEVMKKDLQEYIQIQGDNSTRKVELLPVQVFVRDLMILLKEAGGRMLLANFESSYLNRFGVACRPASLGFPNSTALVQSLDDYVLMKGKKMKRIIVLNRENVPELPNYSPPIPVQSQAEPREKYFNYPYNPVPPPPLLQKKGANPPSPTSPFDHKRHMGTTEMPPSHLIMGLTPSPQQTFQPPPQQSYQPTSPVLYSGSPVAPNGSVVWGQVWSPQYSVIPPLSPAHYMMPTIPINWGNVPSSPMLNQQTKPGNNATVCGRAPISIQTLEQLGKVPGVPPKPSDLPSPELLTSNGVIAEGFFANGDCSQTSKNHAKKRLAAQFDTQE